MQNNQPKFLTKDELCSAAMRELNVSKLSFDIGWIMAIEDTGRQDWDEPLRRRPRTSNRRALANALIHSHRPAKDGRRQGIVETTSRPCRRLALTQSHPPAARRARRGAEEAPGSDFID
jgi:hypothetical protein